VARPAHHHAHLAELTRSELERLRGRRVGLCGVCRRPVHAGDLHLWIRDHVFHEGCTPGLFGHDAGDDPKAA
jgi:hypothetical protein